MRELRHDFRRVYHVAYDDVPTDEAIDLIESLPQGSRYVAATDPARAWSEGRHLAADVVDATNRVAWALGLWSRDSAPEPPTVTRPRDAIDRARKRAESRSARAELESDQWQEV